MKEYVFVARIWYEYREIAEGEPRLRGVLQHMMTGERQYFNELSHITAFLAAHLNLPIELSEDQTYQSTDYWAEGLGQEPTRLLDEPEEEDGSI